MGWHQPRHWTSEDEIPKCWRNLRLNCVSPGPTDTELFHAGKSDEQRQTFARAAAFNCLGDPGDIARVVAFLAGADSGWMTGQNLRVNCGVP